MLHDLLRVDDRWYTADIIDYEGDPLRKTFVLRCTRRVEDESWVLLKQFLRRWASQNDCSTKDIRRYSDRVELDLFIKYTNRESDFSPYKELPTGEKRWRAGNERLKKER